MCPVESPAGADRAPPRFSRGAACRIVGLAPSDLARWEDAAGREAGLRLPASLSFADLVALAVLREVSRQVGARLDDFAVGLAELFTALAERTDVGRLNDHVALVGCHYARLAPLPSDHVRCVGDGFIVVPLCAVLRDLHDQACS
jgi:hypothetical protein